MLVPLSFWHYYFAFSMFLADLFVNISDKDITTYADDNMPHTVTDNIDDGIKSLEEASAAFLQWFANNLLKNKSEKC